MDVLINYMGEFFHNVNFKYLPILFVNYTSTKPKKTLNYMLLFRLGIVK